MYDPEGRKQWSDDATYTMSRAEIYDKLMTDVVAQLDGVNVSEVRGLLELTGSGGIHITKSLKHCVKHARLLGIHVSPTAVFNGIRDDSVSSSWGATEWGDFLGRVGLAASAASSTASSSSSSSASK